MSRSDDVDERAQAAREAAVLEKLLGVGAPSLYDFRMDGRWFDNPAMCMQFIHGEHRELSLTTLEDVERLGSVVASVHNHAVDDLAAIFPGERTTASYIDQWVELIDSYFPRLRDPLPHAVEAQVHRAQLVVSSILERATTAAGVDSDDALVLLHGDIAPGNILWGDQPVLIDWEYARMGDPADEVAYVFGQNGLGSRQREGFWAGYRRTTTHPRPDLLAERVRWWEPVILLGSALWWLERWSRRADAEAAGTPDPSVPKSQRYYLDQALLRLDRLDEAVKGVAGSQP